MNTFHAGPRDWRAAASSAENRRRLGLGGQGQGDLLEVPGSSVKGPGGGERGRRAGSGGGCRSCRKHGSWRDWFPGVGAGVRCGAGNSRSPRAPSEDGGAQEEHVGRGFLGTRGLRACLEETRQVRCLPTGSLRRAGNL